MQVNLATAITHLKNGAIVAFPTETVYGLGGSIESEQALSAIFHVKERPFFDPLIVHIADFKQATELAAQWTELEQFLAKKFWPGPLTIVTNKKPHVSNLITSGLPTVGLRMPNHPLALELIRATGPLAAPSANKFGHTSPTTAEHVEAEFKGLVGVLNGGACEGGIESTVIHVSQNKTIEILRPGLTTEEDLKRALFEWPHPTLVTNKVSTAAPGHLAHHYQPTTPLVLLPRTPTSTDLEHIQTQLQLSSIDDSIEIVLSDNAAIAARELYAQLRFASEQLASFLWLNISKVEKSGLWSSIWDRLSKAQSLILD